MGKGGSPVWQAGTDFVVGAVEPAGTPVQKVDEQSNSTCTLGPGGVGECGVSVAESALDPPGPIPNPVVTRGSAGEYCGGDPVGGEAVAGTPHARTPRGPERAWAG